MEPVDFLGGQHQTQAREKRPRLLVLPLLFLLDRLIERALRKGTDTAVCVQKHLLLVRVAVAAGLHVVGHLPYRPRH